MAFAAPWPLTPASTAVNRLDRQVTRIGCCSQGRSRGRGTRRVGLEEQDRDVAVASMAGGHLERCMTGGRGVSSCYWDRERSERPYFATQCIQVSRTFLMMHMCLHCAT